MAKQGARKMKTATPPARRVVAVAIKGNEDWKEWLERAAKHCRTTISGLFDLSVSEYVKTRGFTEEPPER